MEEEEERGFLPTVRDYIFHTSRGERRRESFFCSVALSRRLEGETATQGKNSRNPKVVRDNSFFHGCKKAKEVKYVCAPE